MEGAIPWYVLDVCVYIDVTVYLHCYVYLDYYLDVYVRLLLCPYGTRGTSSSSSNNSHDKRTSSFCSGKRSSREQRSPREATR